MANLSRSLRSWSGRDRDLAWKVLAPLFLLALALAWFWSLGAERRAIQSMEPAERRAVYEQSFGELQILCGTAPRGDALEKRCLEQVLFILKFPECDARCDEIARSHMPRPTK